jgi:enamine deaminase RidA (YjgF/YER057c/UK114 family)
VLQVTIYLTNLAEKADFNRAWKAHFKEVNLPARAAIGVADIEPDAPGMLARASRCCLSFRVTF